MDVGYAQLGPGKDVEVISVVRTRLARRGRGTNEDPVRSLTQYWSLDGELLAEIDHWAGDEAQRDALRHPLGPE